MVALQLLLLLLLLLVLLPVLVLLVSSRAAAREFARVASEALAPPCLSSPTLSPLSRARSHSVAPIGLVRLGCRVESKDTYDAACL
jgi:hypothetical protein